MGTKYSVESSDIDPFSNDPFTLTGITDRPPDGSRGQPDGQDPPRAGYLDLLHEHGVLPPLDEPLTSSTPPPRESIKRNKGVAEEKKHRPASKKLSKSEKAQLKKEFYAKFETSLRTVCDIWDDFEAIRGLDIKDVDMEIAQPLVVALDRLVEQHNFIVRLQADRHDMLSDLDELNDENEQLQMSLRLANDEVAQLKEDLATLSGELCRRGVSAQIAINKRRSLEVKPTGSRGHSRQSSGNLELEVSPSPSPTPTSPTKAPGLAYKATPLVQALKDATLRKVDEPPKRDTESPSGNRLRRVSYDPVVEKREEKNEEIKEESIFKMELQNKLKSMNRQSSQVAGVGTLRKRNAYTGIHANDVVRSYKKLEVEALTKILGVVQIYASEATEKDIRKFICRLFEIAFKKAQASAENLQHMLRTLILNPIQPLPEKQNFLKSDTERRETTVTLYTATTVERLKFLSRTEMPEQLSEQIRSYVESISETASTTPLQQMVLAALLEECPDLMSSSLIQNSSFRSFLVDCCRAAWLMSVMNPSMHISTDTHDGTVQQKLHHVLVTGGEDAQHIDYFAWPVLYSKQYGDVLHTGTVVTC